MISWKNEFIDPIINDNSGKWRLKENGVVTTDLPPTLSKKFHEKMPKGAALREFTNINLHLAYWETPYYIQALNRFITNKDVSKNSVAIDIGCGDGRFTEYLLNRGFKKVIATDAHLKPLDSLAEFAKENGYSNNLLIIHCSAECIPLKENSIDLALAIGVYYYLNDKFDDCINEVNRILKKGAFLINSEPDLEGAIYKSIIFEDIDDIIENYNKRVFKEEKGDTDYKFRLFEKSDIKRLLTDMGFTLLDCHGLSLLPSILRIKMVRDELSEDKIRDKEKDLREVFDYFNENGSLFKHIIWKSSKNGK